MLTLAIATAATGAAAAPRDLSDYAGRYPFTKVHGRSFLTERSIVRGVRAAVREPAIVREVLSAGVAGPIARVDGLLYSWACRPHMCGPVNWAIVARPRDGRSAVCYHDADLTGNGSRWFAGGRAIATTRGDCGSAVIPAAALAALR